MILVEGYADVDGLDAFLEELAAVGEDCDCVVQAFDARLVAGDRHLERALACARRAIDRGEAIARDPAVEVLCYAAGRRQIEDALELGVEPGRSPVVVLVASLADGGRDSVQDDDVDGPAPTADEERAAERVRELVEPAALERGSELGDPERLRAYFEIGDDELAASDADLETLVCERVALLTVER